MPDAERYHTVKEIAEALDVSYVTALRYIKKGLLKSIRIGGQWRIPAEELSRFIREGNLSRGCGNE